MAHVMRPVRGLEARPTPTTRGPEARLTPTTRATMARTQPPAPGSMARLGRAVEVTQPLSPTRGPKVRQVRVLP